ncbi:bZIP transcription factor [Clostridium sp. 001]|uniref:bZIP transcription factor n=1 Tax=Clostridium sp. 001 TaxID=1970093 RepID=UPI001C2BDF8D|nr:bZIP transcription factor [Clostridium sp. 001]QXE20012.1 hypothetical protein B5S50_14930 [Clostridium sp. 001]
MLSVQTIQMLISGGVVGIVLGSGGVFAFLNKKGVNISKDLDNVDKVITAVEPIISAGKEIAPLNPIVTTADLIEHWAKIGVGNAEQLYHAGKLVSDKDRFKSAHDTVCANLKELNINPTENQQKIIDDVIQYWVNDLGHKDKTDAEREAEKQTLQAKIITLTNENAQLKQTISNVQSNLTSAQPQNTPQ